MQALILTFFTLILSAPTFSASCSQVDTLALRRLIDTITYPTPYDSTLYRGKLTAVRRPTGERPTLLNEFGGYSFRRFNNSYRVIAFRCGNIDDSQCQVMTEESWLITKDCLYVDGLPANVTKLTKSELRFNYNRDTSSINDSYTLRPAKRLDVVSVLTSPELTYVKIFSGTGE